MTDVESSLPFEETPLPRKHYVVVGDWMTDVVAKVDRPLRYGTDTHGRIRAMGGGSAANTACWLAANGQSVAYVGRVGDDVLGRAGTEHMRTAGVVPYVAVDPVLPSGTCIVIVGPDGERTMLPDPGANAGLEPADLPDALFVDGAHLHLSGYVLLVEGSRPAGLAALARARACGMTTSVDVASAGPLADTGGRQFLSWMGHVDLLFANEHEARVLVDLPEGSGPRAAAEALSSVSHHVVVKLGAEGALWLGPAVQGESQFAQVSAHIADVVDTTGAGDAFAAGFLPAHFAGADAVTALTAGTQLAAQCVALVGGRPN